MTVAKSIAPPSDVSEARYHLGIAIRFLLHATEHAQPGDQRLIMIEMLALIRNRLNPKYEPCTCEPGKCAGMHNFE